jgi:hypothetical protein
LILVVTNPLAATFGPGEFRGLATEPTSPDIRFLLGWFHHFVSFLGMLMINSALSLSTLSNPFLAIVIVKPGILH